MAVPPMSGFIRTAEFDVNPVPTTVITVAAAFTLALVGLTDAIVGAPPSTENVSALLVPAAVFTVICGVPPPPISDAAMVAVNCESLTCCVVTFVAEPFH